MTAEGLIAIAAGLAASSIALVGAGIDSAIEGLASVIVIWRFWGARALSAQAERRAQKMVAASYFLLAPYVAGEAIATLATGQEPGASWLGVGLTAASAVFMPLFGLAKRRVGDTLGSAATVGEGTQNLLCAYLSLGVLAGLAANAVAGWWWADPAAALVIAAVAVREGARSWRGESCCPA
ncbi:MAG: hypothetical protein C4306_03245 [Thermoleophilia bacterium]